MASKALLTAGLPPPDLTRIDKLSTLHHVRWIDNRLDDLLKAIKDGDMTTIKHAALNIKTDVTGLKMCHSNMIEPIHYNEHLPQGSTAPARVFGITELLELILRNVDFYDLMRCYHVNRRFRDVLDGSKRCQEALFLRPTPPPSSSLPTRPLPLAFPTFTTSTSGGCACNTHRRLSIEITKLPTAIGTRWRDMFISSPPVKEVDVRVGWQRGENSHTRYYMPYRLVSDVGVTVGDLVEDARRSLENEELGEGVGWSLWRGWMRRLEWSH